MGIEKSRTWDWRTCSGASEAELEHSLKQLEFLDFYTDGEAVLSKEKMKPCKSYVPRLFEGSDGEPVIRCQFYNHNRMENGGCDYIDEREDAREEGNDRLFERYNEKLGNMCPDFVKKEVRRSLREAFRVQQDSENEMMRGGFIDEEE
jgi:hypothetical protein